jgi:hypothetical protein
MFERRCMAQDQDISTLEGIDIPEVVAAAEKGKK